MSLAERARVALKGEWAPGMAVDGIRLHEGSACVRGTVPCIYPPDLTDEVTVLALAIVCRRRLDACDAANGVTVARRGILAAALADWADSRGTLEDLADAVIGIMEL